MVAIRLRRAGSKKRPFFRIVVTDSRAARDSSFVEILGYYNPRTKPAIVKIEQARVDHWIKMGAQPSDSVRTLIARHLTVAPVAAVTPVTAVAAVAVVAPVVQAVPVVAAEAPAASEPGGRIGGMSERGPRAVVEVLAKALTERPDEVVVRESTHKGTTLLELYVGAGEQGRVIGRQGRIVAALRTLAQTAAEVDGQTVTLEIRDGRP